jgi:phenylacetate-CoA ligase
MLDLTPRRHDLDPIEIASREEIEALQLERLQRTLRWVYERVDHYRRAFEAAGVHPGDLASRADLARFPFTRKEDSRKVCASHQRFAGFSSVFRDLAERNCTASA